MLELQQIQAKNKEKETKKEEIPEPVVIKTEPVTEHDEHPGGLLKRSPLQKNYSPPPPSSSNSNIIPSSSNNSITMDSAEQDHDLMLNVPSLDDVALEMNLSPRNILEAFSSEDIDMCKPSSFIDSPPPYLPSKAQEAADQLEDIKGKIIQEMYMKSEQGEAVTLRGVAPPPGRERGKQMEEETIEGSYEMPIFTDDQINMPLKQLYGQLVQMDRPHPYNMPGKFNPGGVKPGEDGVGPIRGHNAPGRFNTSSMIHGISMLIIYYRNVNNNKSVVVVAIPIHNLIIDPLKF